MKQIVVINGFHSGKDTFVKYCGEFANVVNYSYVDFTRNMLKETGVFSFEDKTDDDRVLLAAVNKALEQHPLNIPLNDCLDTAEQFIKDEIKGDVLFVHIRDPKAIKTFVRDINMRTGTHAIAIAVKRNCDFIAVTEEDKNVGNFSYHGVIYNDGRPEDLKVMANSFIRFLKKDWFHSCISKSNGFYMSECIDGIAWNY